MKKQTKEITNWQRKFNREETHKVKILEKRFADMLEGSSMLIATPKIIDQFIRKIPKGKTRTLKQMRQSLARKFSADNTCPVTSGIFLRIVAEASFEKYITGEVSLEKITPFWRIIDEKSPLAEKLTFGKEFIQKMRIREGIR